MKLEVWSFKSLPPSIWWFQRGWVIVLTRMAHWNQQVIFMKGARAWKSAPAHRRRFLLPLLVTPYRFGFQCVSYQQPDWLDWNLNLIQTISLLFHAPPEYIIPLIILSIITFRDFRCRRAFPNRLISDTMGQYLGHTSFWCCSGSLENH